MAILSHSSLVLLHDDRHTFAYHTCRLIQCSSCQLLNFGLRMYNHKVGHTQKGYAMSLQVVHCPDLAMVPV